jgi:hypothetical protein
MVTLRAAYVAALDRACVTPPHSTDGISIHYDLETGFWISVYPDGTVHFTVGTEEKPNFRLWMLACSSRAEPHTLRVYHPEGHPEETTITFHPLPRA